MFYEPNPMDVVEKFMHHSFDNGWNEEPHLEQMTAYEYYKEYGDTGWITPYNFYHDYHYLLGLTDLHKCLHHELLSLNDGSSDTEEKRSRCRELFGLIDEQMKYFAKRYPKIASVKVDDDPAFNLLIQYFERPSTIIKEYGLFTACVKITDIVAGKVIFREVEELHANTPCAEEITRRVQAEYFYQNKVPMQLVDEYIEWPSKSSWNEKFRLSPNPIEYYLKLGDQPIWLVPAHVHYYFNLINGLADLYTSVQVEIRWLVQHYSSCADYTTKKERCIDLLECIDIKLLYYRNKFPQIKNEPISERLGLNLLLTEFTKSTDVDPEHYWEWIPVQNISRSISLIEMLEAKHGIRIENRGFIH